MKAVIPVAGAGTRLRPHTYSTHKVLLPVAGKPILEHIVDELLAVGVTEMVFVIGYLGDQIRDHLLTRYGERAQGFVFAVQAEQKGLGHAIHMAKPHLAADEPVIIVLGDTVFRVDFQTFVEHPGSVLCVKEVPDPRRFGVVEVRDGLAVHVVEKPSEPVSHLALVGLYKIRHSGALMEAIEELFAKDIRTKNEYQLTDALEILIRRGERMAVMPIEGWYDCGKAETVLETNRTLLELRPGPSDSPSSRVVPPVHIDPSAVCEDCVIGPFVSVGPAARLRRCVVRNSVIGPEAVLEDLVLEDSLVGRRAVAKGRKTRLNIGDDSDLEP